MKIQRPLTALLFLSVANAAVLKQETLDAWDTYVRQVDAGAAKAASGSSFLWTDQSQERRQQIRAGEIVAAPAVTHSPRHIPSGLIHHWIGAEFIPGVKLDDVFSVVRDYDAYPRYYRPNVIDSRSALRNGVEDQFSLVLANRSFLVKAALESDYRTLYSRVDERRCYAISSAVRMREVEDYGEPGEHQLPDGQGSGYIWRLHSITRFEERDGGVYVELEAIALSRDMPASLGWLVEPIVRRISRNSLLLSLRQTRDAVTGQRERLLTAAPSHGQSPSQPSGLLPGAFGLKLQ